VGSILVESRVSFLFETAFADTQELFYVWTAVRRGAMNCTPFVFVQLSGGWTWSSKMFLPLGHGFCSMVKLGGGLEVGCRV